MQHEPAYETREHAFQLLVGSVCRSASQTMLPQLFGELIHAQVRGCLVEVLRAASIHQENACRREAKAAAEGLLFWLPADQS